MTMMHILHLFTVVQQWGFKHLAYQGDGFIAFI